MKITNIGAYIAGDQAQQRNQSGPLAGYRWIFVRVDTDEGVSGWGEVGSQATVGESLMVEAIRQVADSYVGEDPADIERLWHKGAIAGSRISDPADLGPA